MAQQAADAGAEDPLAWVEYIDIDVKDPTVEGYKKAVDWLNKRDLKRAGGDVFRGIPITSKTAGWRRINLVNAGKPTVSLLIDEIDCYPVAINSGDGRGWFRFTDRDVPEGAQASSMGLRSSYPVLSTGFDRTELVFGLPILNHAHHILSTFDPDLGVKHPTMKRQRKVLMQMIMMFCEVLRFKLILAKIENMIAEGTTRTLDALAWEWVCNWSTISSFALKFKDQEAINVMVDAAEDLEKVVALEINNRDDVVDLLGLILRKIK